MIDRKLLDVLVCPENKEPLHFAEPSLLKELNARIERGEVKNRSGKTLDGPVEAGLVREDGAVLYPIEDDVPILLVEEGILLG
ncbi:MAG: Trm112 family protein [Candidatus Eiseniibacteriota bacterium]|jgi:uncharacterized protein YbaR (Trm112 family)